MTTDQQANDALRALTREPVDLSEESLRTVLAAIPTTPQQRSWLPPFPRWRYRSMVSATKFIVAGVIVALVGGFLLIGQPFDQQRDTPGATSSELGTVSPTGSLAQPRHEHSATLLPDGRVLVVGGFGGDDIGIASAEVWDPGTGTFDPAGSLAEPRWGHTTTVLPDGRGLVVGGVGKDSAEIWDPDTGTFGPAGSLASSRGGHTATLLPDGRVLVVGGGGDGWGGRLDSAEIWDPATGRFSLAGSYAPHQWYTVTALPDGRVLVVGSSWAAFPSAEVWDPVTRTFSPAGTHALGYGYHTAVLLPDGRVLVVDGQDPPAAAIWDAATRTFSPPDPLAMDWINSAALVRRGYVLVVGGEDATAAEVWDPDTGTFGPTSRFTVHVTSPSSLPAEKGYYSTTALPDGRVVIIGGCTGPDPCGDVLASVEVWDPVTDTVSPAGSLTEGRIGHSATPLSDGRVLVVGGSSLGGHPPGGGVHASAEIWTPSDR